MNDWQYLGYKITWYLHIIKQIPREIFVKPRTSEVRGKPALSVYQQAKHLSWHRRPRKEEMNRTLCNLKALFWLIIAFSLVPPYYTWQGIKWFNGKWKSYYYRIIGYGLFGAGAGLILDELIHGPFTLTPANHEFWGLIAIIAGAVFISRKPHGKEQ